MDALLIIVSIAFAALAVWLFRRAFSRMSSRSESLDKPAHNDVYVAAGYEAGHTGYGCLQ